MQAQKRGKPRKILFAKHVTKWQQNIFKGNAKQLLLSLPPEIRTRIWEYVLGGQTIHIKSSDPTTAIDATYDKASYKFVAALYETAPGLRHCTCSLHEDEDTTIAQIRAEEVCVLNGGYARKHQGCWKASGSKLYLDVLKSCRQIHQEAALLPYRENTFSVDMYALLDFMRALMPAQTRIISRMLLHTIYARYYGNNFAPMSGITRAFLDARLSGLHSLIVLVHNRWQCFSHAFQHKYSMDEVARHIDRLSHLPLTSALVAITFEQKNCGGPGAPVEIMSDWVEMMESKLLVTDEHRTAEKRERDEQQAAIGEERRKRNRTSGRLRALKE